VIVDRGCEGVVAKRLTGSYRRGQRDWIKVTHRGYRRYENERELARSFSAP
jgi:ATP-dependent DNA ligase